uniref:Ig-like domain-containing protein n=1 Tax=Gopherus agassizii TaxID=38772 RepID=A0A452HDW1_9SAUR
FIVNTRPALIKCNHLYFLLITIRMAIMAQFTVIGPDQPVTAIVGEDIVLPCHLSPAMSAENMEVRWSRSDYSSFVHRYRDGKDQTEYQIPEYTGRTEFLKDGIRNGSVALRLHNIRPMDEGRYTCYFESTSFYNDAHMELEVAAFDCWWLLIFTICWASRPLDQTLEFGPVKRADIACIGYLHKQHMDFGPSMTLKHVLKD